LTRITLIACLLGLVAIAATAFALARGDGASAQVPPPTEPAPGVPRQLVLQIGDTVRVEGARLGCQVTRRDGRAVIECRRAGDPAGTYGTFTSDRSVTVARFRSGRRAQTILTARHGGGWRACARTGPTATASASRACR
jgi:hypothetical protein